MEHYHILWQKTENGMARLIRVYGEYSSVQIPVAIEGCKVTEVGAYCFSQKKNFPKGEILESFCGDDKELELHELCGDYVEQIRLPDSVEKIGQCAFYNCTKLRKLEIGKELRQIESDAFMNCRTFTQLWLRARIVDKTGLKQILAQISSGLEVHIWNEKEVHAVLFYPEYTESYDEIAPAHIFGRNIEGEGFRARQCFKEGVLDYESYDRIFEKACVEEDENTLFHLAWDRLCYPVALKEEYKRDYEGYVREHALFGAELFLKKKDLTAIEKMFCHGYLTEVQQDWMIQKSAGLEWIEGTASMLKWKQEMKKMAKSTKYDFEDF